MKQKNTKNKIFWARISYWTGAIVDLLGIVILNISIPLGY